MSHHHSRRKKHGSVDRRTSGRRKKRKGHAHKGREKRKRTERREQDTRRLAHDRRRHTRFPIAADLIKPVEFNVFPSDIKGTQPGIVTHLSPGGMTLLSFTPIKVGSSMFFSINLPHFTTSTLEGQVVRVESKGESYLAGIHFTQISPDDRERLNLMGLDYSDCELKLSFGIKDVCFKDCGFYVLCDKPVKI